MILKGPDSVPLCETELLVEVRGTLLCALPLPGGTWADGVFVRLQTLSYQPPNQLLEPSGCRAIPHEWPSVTFGELQLKGGAGPY